MDNKAANIFKEHIDRLVALKDEQIRVHECIANDERKRRDALLNKYENIMETIAKKIRDVQTKRGEATNNADVEKFIFTEDALYGVLDVMKNDLIDLKRESLWKSR